MFIFQLSFWLAIFGSVVAFFIFRVAYFTVVELNRKRWNKQEENVLFQIKVGRENERGPLVMEQVFASLHGIYEKLPLWERIKGRQQDRLSFEIANIDNKIRFYMWCPKKYKNLVEGQMYAQYPEIEIEQVNDYAVTQSKERMLAGYEQEKIQKNIEAIQDPSRLLSGTNVQYAVTAELAQEAIHLFPIKRYGQFEDRIARVHVDPLAGITAALTQLNNKNEQAWIQIVVQPVGDYWRKKGLKTLKILKKICNRWPFKEYFYLQGKVENLYMTRSWLQWILNMPIYCFLWFYRGGGGIAPQDPAQQADDDDELKQEMTRTHDRETTETAAVTKVSQLGFDTSIRMVYVPSQENIHLAEMKLREMAGSFKQFNMPYSNGFKIRCINQNNRLVLNRFKDRELHDPFVLSIEELASVFHLPNILVQTPNIQWVTSRRLEPPTDVPTEITVPKEEFTMLGATNFRGQFTEFGIKAIDRRRHIYIIGKTGMGKSTLLENMIFSDIQNGKGVAVIDPHGDLADAVIDFVPSHRTNDMIIFDPSDIHFPVSFNMLECPIPEHRTLVASGLLGVFKKMYADSWGPRLEHILRNTILALLEFPNSTMLGIMRMLVDNKYRKKVVKQVTNPMVRSFWLDEFAKMQERQRTEAISPIQNKVGQFLSSPVIRNIVGQTKSSFNIRYAMDNKKIVVVNLSKGKLGEDNSSLLGSMLITKFQLDAMSRADMLQNDRTDFYLYVDEFQNFATDSFATILSEARKYRLNLTMANQYVAQMPEEVRDAVFGNVGTMISFQVGYDDADIFSKQYSEEVTPNDIVSLPKYTAYSKLMIDGMPSKVFSVNTLPPPNFDSDQERREKILRVSREKYATPRETVEDKILRWSGMKQNDQIDDDDEDNNENSKKSQPNKNKAEKQPPKKINPQNTSKPQSQKPPQKNK